MFWGWVWYIQLVSGAERMPSKYASAGVSAVSQNRSKGRSRVACCLPIRARTSSPLPPASRTRILVVEFSESLLARTRPARPPPAITKSYESLTSPGAINDRLLKYEGAADASDKEDNIIILVPKLKIISCWIVVGWFLERTDAQSSYTQRVESRPHSESH